MSEFQFEDQRIAFHQGDTVASALTASGHYDLTDGPGDRRRGVFCGMGVCQACAVAIEGRGVRRACMEPAVAGMHVRRFSGVGAPEPVNNDAGRSEDAVSLEPELLVIGGGPAGLSAACRAAELGVEVILLDERGRPGGQYYKQPGSGRPTPERLVGDRQFTDGSKLIDRALEAGVRIVSNATLWGAFPGPELAVAVGEWTQVFKPRRLLIAAGAYENGLAIPGWTLPRVMTTGAAQTLLRSYGVNAGERVLVAGNGPLNLQVALELRRAGADIVLLTELSPMFDASAAISVLRMFAASPAVALRGASLMAALRTARVPFRRGWGVAGIREEGDALAVDVGPAGASGVEVQKTLMVDALCLGYGFLPNNEALRMLGCRHEYDAARGYLITVRSERCETSVAGVYAVGDCCGLGGAPAAMEEGTIAAIAIAESFDRLPDGVHLKAAQRAKTRLRRHRRFQQALWRFFRAPPPSLEWAAPDTPVCRCENVTLADLEASIEAGDASLAAIKQRTRLGMGACQGRYCASLAAQALENAGGETPGEYSMFAPQAPLKPLSINQLCAEGDDD